MKNGTKQSIAKRIVIAVVLAIAVVTVSGCSQSISYKPTGFPLKVTINNRGEVLFGAEASISTPIGAFSIGVEQTINPEEDIITLIVRDRRKAADKVDAVYRIQMEDQNVVVTLDGKTTLEISKRLIVVDVTEGTVRTIEFTKKNHNSGQTQPLPNQGDAFTDNLNGAKLEMIRVPSGNFLMGSPESEAGHSGYEDPQHHVTVRSFYIGKYEVTQAQWEAVMGNNPANFKGDKLPVEQVSWNDAKAFCEKLSRMTSKAYRLPSEAEWEYACRAGTTGAYAGNLDEMAWYGGYNIRKHSVGQKRPNAFGLFDMHGNVSEWCEDVWHDNYNGAPRDGSAWLIGGNQQFRLIRGAAWVNPSLYVRSAVRQRLMPHQADYTLGIRVVVSAGTP
jgi:formylglycine-generating enzyme required for sulfatase activity